MNSTGIPSSDPGRSGRIEEVVAREMNRSRRLLWLYVLLLVIPLGACAVYYQYGRTDVALVHSEVNSNIAPYKQIIEQAKPALAQVRQTADQLSAQETRLNSLSQEQQALATTVQAVPEKLQQIDSVRADLSGVKTDMAVVRTQNQELRGALENTRNGVEQLNQRFSSVEQQQSVVQRDLKELSTRVQRIPPVNSDDQLKRQQELINSLMQRIQKLEQTRRIDPRTVRPQ